MSAPAPKGERQLVHVDHIPSIRDSTARLLGAVIYEERTKRGISEEGFADSLKRTKDWLAAVERGEVIPTEELVLVIEEVLIDNPGANDADVDVDLFAVVEELELRPYGQVARCIRHAYDIPLELDSSADSGAPVASNSANPVVASVRATDRLLVLSPLLVVIALATVGAALLFTTTPLPTIDWTMPVLSTGALVGFFALVLTPLDRILDRLAEISRNGKARDSYALALDIYNDAGLTPPPGVKWYSSTHEKHLLRGARYAATRWTLLADFAERLSGLVSLLLIAAAPIAIAEAWAHDPGKTGISIFYLAALALLAAAARYNAMRAAARGLHALARGCGYQLEKVRAETPPG